MKLSDLVAAIKPEGVSAAATEGILKSLGATVQEQLKAGNEVVLPGIGKLSVKSVAARTGRNPRTGDSVEIPAKNAPKFSASKQLKDAVNG